ncbi:hypothetical protein ACO0LB_18550 [Undibacterium sp. SXout7W]|uniref:hypothetical protein n=1 Tax=Undibacterium sp. SXout7W TaxID=3413049 RepID=UPI003BF29D45
MKHSYDGYCRPDSAPTVMYAYKGTLEEGRKQIPWEAEVKLGEEVIGTVKGFVDPTSEIGEIRRAVEAATKVAINQLHDQGR